MNHRVLIVGTGSIGERHLRCLQSTGRCELALCEPLPERRVQVAEKYAVEAYASLDEALQRGRFTAAVVATPAPLHVPIATRLAEQNVHLLIEKPLSTSWAGVEQLASLIETRRLVAAIGYMHRAHPCVVALKQAIDAGRLGTISQLRIDTGQPLAVFRPAYRDIYFASHEQGGGALADCLTHFFSVGEWLCGPIERLVADAAHRALEGVTVEDTVHVLARQDRVLSVYAANLYQQPNEVTITVVGDAATGRVEYAKQRWSLMEEPAGQWQHESLDVPHKDVMYIRQDTAFLDRIEGHGKLFCDLSEGMQTLKVNLAAHTSLREQGWQVV